MAGDGDFPEEAVQFADGQPGTKIYWIKWRKRGIFFPNNLF